ncbi:hypothetical protein EQP59_10605 [Ornithobacterium rhinotracheale]|uniref:NmrA-like domain-containing protein n=1 Tax=Ornithobacterium rhinotracheale TaxID=28251 RepID=A0A410JUT7_ORNRH|nr:hypothetical protein [Ornithobacterium rhinotracheale]QAR31759.1 hypothetical protein EQP59_10605 [Ornithobacterium rhinotracheale]
MGAKIIAQGTRTGIIELASRPFTFQEFAQATEKALGYRLQMSKVSFETLKNNVEKLSLTPLELMMITNFTQYMLNGNNGEDIATPTEFEAILGRPLTSLSEVLKEFI